MSRSNELNINSRLVSSVQKREIMWNIIEPGDPYDIRKSMIAKLPGRKNFMGQHLELVCLLQAAQIQRLCQYLDQYKLKFRQIERKELDRHSFEVQIKELVEQLGEEGTYKNQNAKLRQFVRKQTSQFEDLKKKQGFGAGYESKLIRKYEESLKQIQILYKENQFLKRGQGKLREYQQIINAKNLQNDQLLRRLRSQSARGHDNQKNQAYYKLEIQFKKLQFEAKRIKQINETKNKQIDELQNKSRQLIYQIQQKNHIINQYANINHTIAEYQNRFGMLGQEIDRLNLVLRDKSNEANDIGNQYKLAQEDSRRKAEIINQLQARLIQIQQAYRLLEKKNYERLQDLSTIDQHRNAVRTYEFNIEKLSIEIERLNNVLKKKVADLEEASRKISQYEYEIHKNQGIKRQVEDFHIKYGQFNRKIISYENNISMLNQQADLLKQNLKHRMEEVNSLEQQLKNKGSDVEGLSKNIYDLQLQYSSELNRKEQYYTSEIQRLNRIIKNLQAERESPSKKEQFKTLQFENQRITQQYEYELKRRIKENEELKLNLGEYEKRIMLFAQENQRLNKLSFENKYKLQYQNKFAIMNQEIERLTENLRAKTFENKNYQTKINNYELELRTIQTKRVSESDFKINQLERKHGQSLQEVDRLKQENNYLHQQLTRKNQEYLQIIGLSKQNDLKFKRINDQNNQFRQKLDQYDDQVRNFTNQINRLNNGLKIKVEQVTSYDQRFRAVSKENDDLRRKITQYESKIMLLSQQTERLRTTIQSHRDQSGSLEERHKKLLYDTQAYKRRVVQLETYMKEKENQCRVLEQQVRTSHQEVEALRSNLNESNRIFAEYQNKIVILSQQIERLNNILQQFQKDNIQLQKKKGDLEQLKTAFITVEENFSRISQENEDLRKKYNETSLTKTKLNQQYDNKVRGLIQQNQQYYRQMQQYESKNSYLSQQLQRQNMLIKQKIEDISNLQGMLRSINQQNDNLNRKIQDLSNSNRKLIQYDNKITILSQQIERLNNILKKKVQQSNALETKCRTYQEQIVIYQRKIDNLDSNVIRDLQNKNIYLSKENEEMKIKMRQLTVEANKVPDLQNKFMLILNEVQRLNGNLKLKVEEISSLDGKNRSLEEELRRSRQRSQDLESSMHRDLKNQSSVFQQRIADLTNENEEMRRHLRQLSDINRTIPEYQNRYSAMSKQLERLNEILHKYSKQIVPSLEEKIKMLNLQKEESRRRFVELDQLNKNHIQISNKLKLVTQERDQNVKRVQQYQIRITHVSGQIDRLAGLLRQKSEDSLGLQTKMKQVIAENQQLIKKLKQVSQINRRLPEYENSISLLSQQIQRLNNHLRIKIDELNNSEGKIRVYQHELQIVQKRHNELDGFLADLKNNKLIIQQKLTSVNSENDELRKAIRQLSDSNRRIGDYESRIALLSQQVERLNANLKMKYQELNSAENIFKNYKKDAQIKLNSLNNELEESRRRVGENYNATASRMSEYEAKISKLTQQIQNQNYHIRESTFELQNTHKKQIQYLAEIERLNNTLRLKVQQCSRWDQNNAELKTKLRSYEQHIGGVGNEYEKLKSSYNTLTQEYNKANKHLVEYQQSINKLYKQFERLQNIMQDLKKENYDLQRQLEDSHQQISQLKRKLHQFEKLKQQSYDLKLKLKEAGNLFQMNKVLSAEIQRLLHIVQVQKDDLEQLRLTFTNQSALEKRLKEDMALMVILFAEIQSLRLRVKDTEKQIEHVRRSSLAPFKV